MWVVKIGGSLQSSGYLHDWLESLDKWGRGKVVIVAGGGVYADKVREQQVRLGFDELAAHKRAIQAMEQFAHDLHQQMPSLSPVASLDEIRSTLGRGDLPIWLPVSMLSKNRDLPASWDVTSDSIAAWLALELGFRSLLLVKSRALPGNTVSLVDLAEEGLVDPHLPKTCERSTLQVYWLKRDESHFLTDLPSNPAPGHFPLLLTH